MTDETNYTPQWRAKLEALRLIGRLAVIKSQDPKPEEQPTEPRPERKGRIIRRPKGTSHDH